MLPFVVVGDNPGCNYDTRRARCTELVSHWSVPVVIALYILGHVVISLYLSVVHVPMAMDPSWFSSIETLRIFVMSGVNICKRSLPGLILLIVVNAISEIAHKRDLPSDIIIGTISPVVK